MRPTVPLAPRVPDRPPGRRPWLRVAWLLAALLTTVPCAGAARASGDEDEERRAEEPRLILPGARAVSTGQLVALRWSPADSIRELEILLSVDDGRTFPRMISPRLDPGRCEFVWRVPDLGSPAVWLRIRFNRGGREIEGAPTAPLTVLGGSRDVPQPLALPPPGGPGPARPAGEREPAPLRGTAPGPAETFESPSPSKPAAAPRPTCSITSARHPAGDVRHTALTAPRFLPLRT